MQINKLIGISIIDLYEFLLWIYA